VKPWPGLVDVEPMPGEDESVEGAGEGAGESAGETTGGEEADES
jgi:hypothetical protein